MLVHIPTMKENKVSLTALELNENSEEHIRRLIEQGVIVTDRVHADHETEWQYVRRRQGMGVSDGIAFTLGGFLGGLDTTLSVAHADRLDTHVKYVYDYTHGEQDEHILETILGHPASRAVVENYHLDSLSELFIILSAKAFTTPNGSVIESSTGMIPNYRHWPRQIYSELVASPISHIPPYDETSHVLDKKYELINPMAVYNFAMAGQQLNYDPDLPSDWRMYKASGIANELHRRLACLQNAPESFFPSDMPEELYEWIKTMPVRTFEHKNGMIQRHLLPFDLRASYEGKYLS